MAARKHITLTTFFALVTWQFAPSVNAGTPPSYIVVPMDWGIPEDINDNGMIVGDGGLTVGIWELADGTWEWVCCYPEPHVSSRAYGVNEFNQATGIYFNTLAGEFVPIWYDPDEPPLLTNWGQGDDINDHSQIAGSVSLNGKFYQPMFFDGGAQVVLSAEEGAAYGLNDIGQVVGILWNPATRRYEPTLWEGGPSGGVETTYLGSFGGDGAAEDITEDGWIVGIYDFGTGPSHAFLWLDGEMTDLGTLGGSTSWARAINHHHQIVGMARDRDQVYRAFLWQDNVMYDLNDLVVGGPECTLLDARGLNNRGHIVGRGETPEGDNMGYVLVPVIQGDLTTDGFVDANDLAILLGAWSLPPGSPGCGGTSPCAADVNGDGFVNAADLALLLGAWST